jgi:hypothetical protein
VERHGGAVELSIVGNATRSEVYSAYSRHSLLLFKQALLEGDASLDSRNLLHSLVSVTKTGWVETLSSLHGGRNGRPIQEQFLTR